ncbi:protein kinase A regulatory subunit [Punctularia strigosozonata HHB-11173 SS5]|uniref:protein kinase A regulatory subunit n=1 Tax=Punctularia strigosozonata (strain HHB-11173) TaxID=741275 RepID=UPI0004416725|nr:protein kinase A regulatory subunit [Punctularia strigosozonata HHB-11173 SS5]EIN10586.1 protein kinase A regulatory subunit [Punctularia strigosozonata HHB-11173 SS5]
MSTFDQLVAELTRDAQRVQPKDALQFCANWFQARLEEQRARTRSALAHRSSRSSFSHDVPIDHFLDTPMTGPGMGPVAPTTLSPYTPAAPRTSLAAIHEIQESPFGTLNVQGNALLEEPLHQRNMLPTPGYSFDRAQGPSPLSTPAPPAWDGFNSAGNHSPGDYLHPPSAMILARRTSVSAESINVDQGLDEQPPVYPKSEEQLGRIRASILNNFIFRDLDEEQEKGVLDAMKEIRVGGDEVVIRQGEQGEHFYVVEDGLLHCYIRPEPLPPSWLSEDPNKIKNDPAPNEKFLQPDYHPVFGKKVAECKPGNSFGELALMYGHPRAATVLSMEPCTLWSLDRITFRTIILKAAHRRRTMYEQFLASVPLLTGLETEERSKIADALVSKAYEDGEAVVQQGEMGDTFFFVEEGEAVVTKLHNTEDGETRELEVGTLRKGDYFGELSLLRLAPRAATVSAVRRSDPSQPKLKCAGLDAHAFTRLLGPLREIMERKAGETYGTTYRFGR